jgi:Common central domain of tyrosinase
MKFTRREIVGGAGAFGALASLGETVGFAQSASPVRMSLTDFVKDPARVASLRKGVAVMKARPASDHKSWFFQAAVHAYDDALYADALSRDASVAKVDRERYWNKCTHFGQSSANFPIWHRAYLFYFERILRDAAGDPTLALPYWDYTKPENRDFPQIFASEYLDRAKQEPNPLYHANRDLAFVAGTLGISNAVGQALRTVDSPIFFSEIGTTGFGGDILGQDETQVGLLEQRPHNDIHLAVGGVVGTANGAMADVRTAAFDPVFWVHHANIDRMWVEWASSSGKSWGGLPPEEWLDERAWIFLDVDGSEKTNSRRFYMERRNLPVWYDIDGTLGPGLSLPVPPPPPPPPPPGTPAPVMSAAPRQMMQAPKPVAPREILADRRTIEVSPRSAGSRVLSLQPRVATGSERKTESSNGQSVESVVVTGSRLAAPVFGPNERVLLELGDIKFDRVPSSGFAIYLAPAEQSAETEPVGLLDLFGATHMQMPGTGIGAVQRFDVTSVVAHSPGPFVLRIAPYDLLVSRTGGPAQQRADAVHIGSVRFVVVS